MKPAGGQMSRRDYLSLNQSIEGKKSLKTHTRWPKVKTPGRRLTLTAPFIGGGVICELKVSDLVQIRYPFRAPPFWGYEVRALARAHVSALS